MTDSKIIRPFWHNEKKRSNKFFWLDKNEITIEESQLFNESILKEIIPLDLSIYPELSTVYSNVQNIFSTGEESTLLTAGADGGIRDFFISLSSNHTVIKLNPTFAMINIYPINLERDVVNINYTMNEGRLNFDLEIILSEIEKSTKKPLVILANPDSPTGNYLDLRYIDLIRKKVEKKKGTILIDGTYSLYKGYQELKDIIKLSINSTSLLFTLSFSKFPGLAGARIGLITGPTKYIKQLRSIRPMYEIGALQAKVLNIALQRWDECINVVNQINKNKKNLESLLIKNNYLITPTEGNFTLFRSDNKLNKFLDKVCYYRKEFNLDCLEGLSRLSTPPKKFIKNLESFFEE